MKKRLIALLLCALMVLPAALSSCRKSGEEVSGQESSAVSSAEESKPAQSAEPSSEPAEESSAEESSEEEEVSYERGTVAYSEMVYERPDFEAINAKIAEGEGLLEKSEITEQEMYDFFDDLTNMLIDAITQDSLLQIKQSVDTTDTDMQAESELISEELGNCKKDYFQFANRLLDSEKYSEKVFEEYTEADKQDIRDAASSMDEEYVQLQKRLTELENKYNDADSIVVDYKGTQMTIGDIEDKYGTSEYYKAFNAATGEIYIEIVDIHKKMAQKYGAEDVVGYIYDKSYHRDYTKDDIQRMYAYVKQYIVPLFTKFYPSVSSFYYGAGDYNNVWAHEKTVKKYLESINPKMLEAFDYMKKYGLYIYGDKAEMREGAYTTILYSYDTPIIFHKFSGGYDNLQTFIHEFGHFYEFYTYGDEATAQLDIDEIHSQANELLFLPVYEEIFGEAACKKITRYQLFLSMYSLIQTCVFAEFETRAFEGEYDTVEKLNALFSEIAEEYSMERRLSSTIWSQVHHFFLYPHYYISYGTSIIPSLQIYAESVKDRDNAIHIYNEVVAHSDADTPFLTVLAESGLKDPFTEETFKEIYDMLVEAFPKK